MFRLIRWRSGIPAALCLLAACSGNAETALSDAPVEILRGSTTVLDEPIAYPEGEVDIHAVIVTLLPGEATGWHVHGVPLFAYILEGEVTVTYAGAGTRTYSKGDGVLEAMATAHNGRNTGTVPTRILAVFMGGEGGEATRPVEAPAPGAPDAR